MEYTPEEDEDADTHDVSDELRSEKPASPQAHIIVFFIFTVIFFLSPEQKYHSIAMYVAGVVALFLIARLVVENYFSTRKKM